MQSNNPLFSRDDAFTRDGYAGFGSAPTAEAQATLSPAELQAMYDAPPAERARMTVDDVVAKTALIGLVGAAGAAVSWALGFPPVLTFGGLIVGFILSMVNIFKREVVPGLVLAYGFAEGLFLGGISAIFIQAYPDGFAGINIALAAVVATAATFGGMLFVYSSGRLRATPAFVKFMSMAAIGLLGVLGVSLIVALFGGGAGIFGNGALGLLFSVAMIGFCAFSLILDFEAIQQGVAQGAPAKESWRAAFGLALTLITLYFYLLRLFAILSSND